MPAGEQRVGRSGWGAVVSFADETRDSETVRATQSAWEVPTPVNEMLLSCRGPSAVLIRRASVPRQVKKAPCRLEPLQKQGTSLSTRLTSARPSRHRQAREGLVHAMNFKAVRLWESQSPPTLRLLFAQARHRTPRHQRALQRLTRSHHRKCWRRVALRKSVGAAGCRAPVTWS